MNAAEAAALIVETGVPNAIPCHFDGVVGNTADPDDFVRELADRAPEATAWVLRPGQRLSLTR